MLCGFVCVCAFFFLFFFCACLLNEAFRTILHVKCRYRSTVRRGLGLDTSRAPKAGPQVHFETRGLSMGQGRLATLEWEWKRGVAYISAVFGRG